MVRNLTQFLREPTKQTNKRTKKAHQHTPKVRMQFEEQYDILYKVVLIGDSGVGKSNLMSRYTQDRVDISAKSTVGLEFATKTIHMHGKVIKLQIWDTAGQERFRSITSAYYRNAVGALLLYDITSSETLANAQRRWLKELKENAAPDISVILIGHKCDLVNSRSVDKEEGQKTANKNHIGFLEASAFSNTNVSEAFEQLAQAIYEESNNNNNNNGASSTTTSKGDNNGTNKKTNNTLDPNVVTLNNNNGSNTQNEKKKCC